MSICFRCGHGRSSRRYRIGAYCDRSVAHVTKIIISCKNASTESRRLVKELSHVRGILTTLKDTVDEQQTEPWASVLVLLDNQDGPITQLQELLKQLDCRVTGLAQSRGSKRFKLVLEWPFREAETLKLIYAVERIKSLFELALECSHIRLSKEIASNVGEIAKDIETINQSVQSNTQQLGSLERINEIIQSDVQDNIRKIQELQRSTDDIGCKLQKDIQDNIRQVEELQRSTNGVGEKLQENTMVVESLDHKSKRTSA